MGGEKPFAEVYEGDRDEMELPSLLIDGIVTVCAHEDDEHDSALAEFVKDAERINSAVSARERKAAAQALREASVDLIAAFDGYAHDVSAWLRSRAAALEGGAT